MAEFKGKKDNTRKSGKQITAREAKRARAVERQEVYAALSMAEKLELIEAKPGASKKERARLKAS